MVSRLSKHIFHLPFSAVLKFHFYHILEYYTCVYLFLEHLVYCANLYILIPTAHYFNYCTILLYFNTQKAYLLSVFFSLSFFDVFLTCFFIQVNFRIICTFKKNIQCYLKKKKKSLKWKSD